MQTRRPPRDASDRLGWRVLLGFSESDRAGWPLVRGAQLDIVRRFAAARLVISLAAAVILLPILHGEVDPHARDIWLVLAVLASFATAVPHLGKTRPGPARLPRALGREARLTGLNGLLWAAVPALFGWHGSLVTLVGIWSVLTALMAAMTVTLSALPLATASFIALTGLGLALMMWANGFILLSGVALAFMGAMLFSCLSNGRSFILQHAAEAALAEKREMVSLLLREFDDTGGDWMWQIDSAKALSHVSARFAAALGQTPEALDGQPLLPLLAGPAWDSGQVSASLHDLSEKLRKRERFSGLMLPVELGGETRWWELSATPRYDETGTFSGFRGVGSDVTEAHRSVDRISRMARFDTLTSLPNRAHLMEALDKAIKAASSQRGRCAFLMIDLDRFKGVNDSLGHPVGDRLLVHVADRLRALSSPHEVCGRLGGDEFGVVIRDANHPERIQGFAQRVVASLSQPYDIDGHHLVIGASVGTATSPRDGRTVDMLVRSADLALYRAKHEGGGHVCAYEPQLRAEAEARRLAEIALQNALEKEEMHLVYQPVIDVSAGKIVNVEALLRWTSADLGVIPTDRFLPIARETRLIVPIGNWVVRTACQQAQHWPDTIGLTVNIAAEQLSDSGFVTAVVQALSQSGLAAHRLTIDIAEDILQRTGQAGLAVLDQLDALGVQLSLGEFGTGTSALGHLSQSRFTGVKIHRDLIGKATREDRESAARLRAIVTLAENLGITPTVQGIETEAQLRMAQLLGCRHVQGFLFGRPMTVADLRDHLRGDGAPRAVA